MRGTGVGFMTVAGLLALGACAPAAARWAKAGVGESEMRADLSACRHTADRDVAPAYDRRYDPDAGRDAGPGGGGSPLDGAERQRAGRELDRLVSACMTDLGYARIKPKN